MVGPDLVIPRQGELAKVMEHFSKLTGVPYPRTSYASVLLRNHEYAMENTSTTFIDDANFGMAWPRSGMPSGTSATVHVHELAHSWFGGWLTPRSYADTWLNEGATTFMTMEGVRMLDGEDAYASLVHFYRGQYFTEDSTKYRRPLTSSIWENPHQTLDNHSYQGGASRFHLLRIWLGEDRFWASIRLLFRRRGNGAVSSEDLRTAIWDATGENLQQAFEAWVYGAGYPQVETEEAWNPERKAWSIKVRQVQSQDRGTPGTFPFPLDVRLESTGGTVTKRFWITEREQSFEVPSAEKPKYVVLDGQMAVPMTLKRGRSVDDAILQVSDANPAARILAWDELKDRVAEGEWAEILKESIQKAVSPHAHYGLMNQKQSATKASIPVCLQESHHPSDIVVSKALRNILQADKAVAFTRASELFSSPHPGIRRTALAVLGLGATTEAQKGYAEPVLRAALKDKSYPDLIRMGAAEGLAVINPKDLTDLMLAELSGPAASQYLNILINTLAKQKGDREKIWPRLLPFLHHPNRVVRGNTAKALGDLEAKGALPELEQALVDNRHTTGSTSPIVAIQTALKRIQAGPMSPPDPAKSPQSARVPSPEAAKKELEGIYVEFVRLTLAGKTEEMRQRFRDPRFVPFKLDGQAYTPEEILARAAKNKQGPTIKFLSLEVKPDKVWVEPDGTIHELGTNTSVVQSGEQQPKRSVARYMAVWHRQPDGSLKYRLDLFLD
jgi:aminopeptidase N